MKKKNLLLLAILVQISLFSQTSIKDKLFHSLGYSPLIDLYAGPVSKQTIALSANEFNSQTGQNGGTMTTYTQVKAYSVSFLYRCRYNIHEISDNLSLTAQLIPSLGIGVTNGGASSSSAYIPFNLPLVGGIDFGAGSTYNSTSDYGGFLHVGLEFSKLFQLGTTASSDFSTTPVPTAISSWVNPCISTGIRYWNKKNKLREVNIKYGFGKKNDFTLDPSINTSFSSRVYTFRISWIHFLNY